MPKQQKIIYKVYILKNLITSSTEIFHSDFELFKSLVTGNTSSNIVPKKKIDKSEQLRKVRLLMSSS